MNAEKIDQLERLLGRVLSDGEKERLRRIKDTLGISDNDALWDVLTAMEYQRSYYDDLPEKITRMTKEVFKEVSLAAEKEIALAQSRLADSVVEQARKMSVKTHAHSLVMWGGFALLFILVYGSLLMWAGYTIGSGQTQPPAYLLKVPVGIVIGALCFGGGVLGGILAAKEFSEGRAAWRKHMLLALGGLLPGGWVLGITLI